METMTQTDALAQFDDAVYKYAHQWFRYQSIRSDFDLEDLAQIGRIYILKALEEYKPEAGMTLSTYIIQRIRWGLNTSLRSHMPRAKRETLHFSIDDMNSEQSDRWHPHTEDTPPDFENDQERFHTIISPNENLSLPERTQEMLHMRYVHNLTLKEIGKKYAISKERVRQILEGALIKLKNHGNITDPNPYRENTDAE